ncbi:hypothetical protein DICPUDRAFT_40221 [Dictyostelium purpureum]|uniref:Uncharacterized protein n=1 Tax=Dictyostelium purpureum TaxID=5786 RepID=F0ZXV0_DICPU|nr:uncharacterized protein DICPUDRAFT_40221 [Dictyostelium purpureum]EGC31241.1 hypothetical protein DICPUDRAFT_40221 [Dictyostelium purpureum]|eukprot:XP_003292244.1 hypothetical protein DICPUDRAFT_40221 [Dictyostelium purpureum]
MANNELEMVDEQKWEERINKVKQGYKRNRVVLWIKSKSPFPWINVFSFLVNIPMLVALIILTGVRWRKECSFIGTFCIIYIFIFLGNIAYSWYFHKTMKLKKPRHFVNIVSDCGFSSFFLYTGVSVVIFIICEYLRKGTEYTECYKNNRDIYVLLRGAAGMDIFFLVGFFIINFLNIILSCYRLPDLDSRTKAKKAKKQLNTY